MATVIDSLIVQLGLDPSEFEKGANIVVVQMGNLDKNADRTQKNLQRNGKKGAEFFGEMQKAAIKFFAVLTAGRGLVNFIQQTISGGANLDRMAQNLNTSADSLNRWGQAVKQSGGTAEGFTATMQGLSQAMTEQQQGGSGISKYLADLGVSLVDDTGKAKKLETLLLDIGEGVQRRIPNRPDQVNIMRQMGIDEGTINLLLRGRKEAEALIAAQSAYSKDDSKKAREAEEKWLAAQEKINKLMRDLVYVMLPLATSLVDSLSKAFKEMQPTLTTMANGFTALNETTGGWLGNILMALAALRIIAGLGIIGGGAKVAGVAAGVAGGAVGSVAGTAVALKGDTGPDDQKTAPLKARVDQGDRAAAMELARIQLDNRFWNVLRGKKASEEEVKEHALKLLGSKGREISGKIDEPAEKSVKNIIRENKPQSNIASPADSVKDEIAKLPPEKIAEAEKRNNLPPGIISSVIKQETGGRKEFIENPEKYHYEKNAEGKRVAPHTGKVSTAFGPFGILESTAKDPGYGVKPLQDKSLNEQLRFASEYLAARIKKAGSVSGGVSGYGEGEASKYAAQVQERIPNLSNAGVMSGIQMPSSNEQQTASDSSSMISIGEINIQTAATDARGIAQDIRRELMAQSNYGQR